MPLTYTGRKVKPGGTDHPGIVDIAVGLSRMPRFAGQTRRWFSVLDHSLFCDEMVTLRAGRSDRTAEWTTAARRKIRVCDMETDHLRNTIAMIEREHDDTGHYLDPDRNAIPIYHDMVAELAERDRPAGLRLAVLLHDAHESMTGDVPTDWKGGELKCLQTQLDLDIMDAYFPGGWSAYYNLSERVKRYDRRALVAEAQVVGPPVSLEETVKLFGTTDDTPADVQLLEGLLRGARGQGWFAQPPFHSGQDRHSGVQEFIKRVVNLL